MMTKIKLCGLMEKRDIKTVNELLPDYIGFVFWEKSRRYISPDKAHELKSILDPRIKAAGVFLDAKIEEIEDIALKKTIDVIQLHGHENREYIEALKSRVALPIIQAFVLGDDPAETLRLAEKSNADYILLDSGTGSGETFDWGLLRDVKRPYFLAGGLDQNNVSGAVEALHPFAVDVSSGIETDGKKDPDKMKAFVKAVREQLYIN